MREDLPTLVALGLTPGEIAAMRLDQPAEGDPADLMDVYLRRSAKREDLATLRGHLRDAVRFAERENLGIRHVWFEQVSASKTYVRRREFEGATQAILDGKSKTLAVWKTDRFDRRGMGAVGRMLDDFDKRRARLVSITESLDSSKGGRMVFAILSERAREEAKDIATRVKAGHDAHKLEGSRGTGTPPYGLRSGPGRTVEPDPETITVARGIAERLLKGDSAGAIAADLNATDVPTSRGASWSAGTVSRLAASPLWGGMVPNRARVMDEYGSPTGRWEPRGEPATDASGSPLRCGTGVVSPGEWYLIRQQLSARRSTGLGKGKRAAQYLGTGKYRCGRCGIGMIHQGRSYACRNRAQHGAAVCPGVYTADTRIDHTVGEDWIGHVTALEPWDDVLITIGRRWLAFADPAGAAQASGVAAELASAQERAQRLEDDYYLHGKLSPERYEALAAGLADTVSRLTAAMEALSTAQDVTPLLDGETLREAWQGATLSDRRMLLDCAIGSGGITVMPPAHQGDRSPIGDRLVYDWVSV